MHESWSEYTQTSQRPSNGYVYDQHSVKPFDGRLVGTATTFNQVLQIRDEVIGQIQVSDAAGDRPQHAELITTIAQRLAQHIESLRLLDETERSRQQLNKREFLDHACKFLSDEAGFTVPKLTELMPRCPVCHHLSRPDVVMFGEAVLDLPEAVTAAESCDLMLVLGTSGVVYPAAALPYQAYEQDAQVIEINPTGNYYDSVSEIYIELPAGEGMPKILDALKNLL